MTIVQPAFEFVGKAAETPFGTVVARQLSVWPFAARTTRLFLLVDPSLPDRTLRRGLLRAMQHAYFASDCYSQTRAVREAALAAHYVLRHHNRDVLPLDQINAASAVAALRGDVAFVALAGHAAAFCWRAGELTGQRGILRLPRPLGLERDPLITLWSTPLHAGDRLVLVCGATWQADSSRVIQGILSSAPSVAVAEEELATALGDSQPAGVLVVSSAAEPRPAPTLRLVPATTPPATRTPSAPARRPFAMRRWLTGLFGVALLATVVLAAFTIAPEAPRQPAETPQMLSMIAAGDRIDRVSPAMAVRLGLAAANVVDLAVGSDALYTLDVAEGSLRAFTLDAFDQQPIPDTLVARTGSPIDTAGHRLGPPVAIEYVPGSPPEQGGVAIIDQSRAVVQVGHDRRLSLRTVPTSTTWQTLGALGSDSAGHLLFLDSGSGRLLEYPPLSKRVVDPPRLVLSAATTSNLPFEDVADVVRAGDTVVLRLDDGSLHGVDAMGVDQRIVPRPSDARPVIARSVASDRATGLLVADPASARILHMSLDGSVLRQLRDPALAGIRQMQTSLDGRRLYALVASGVLVFDIPEL